MGRGLDGNFDTRSLALCSFEGPREAGLHRFPVVTARGKHLFPFRTEPLSPSAPMVLGLKGPGRVGRRRIEYSESRVIEVWITRLSRAWHAAGAATMAREPGRCTLRAAA